MKITNGRDLKFSVNRTSFDKMLFRELLFWTTEAITATQRTVNLYISNGHAAFKRKISELENDPQSEGRPIFLIFKASVEPLGGGLSWCPDVNAFEEKFRRLKRQMRLKGIILRVEVGDRHTWKSRRNPFRTDSDLRIDSVPTLINWRSGTSLSGPLTKSMEDLRAFFSSR